MFILFYFILNPSNSYQIRKDFFLINIFRFNFLFFLLISFLGLSFFSSVVNNASDTQRYFGVLGDQEAWLFSLLAAVNFKNMYYSIPYFIGLLLTGSIVATLILFLFIFIYYFNLSSFRRRIYFLFFV